MAWQPERASKVECLPQIKQTPRELDKHHQVACLFSFWTNSPFSLFLSLSLSLWLFHPSALLGLFLSASTSSALWVPVSLLLLSMSFFLSVSLSLFYCPCVFLSLCLSSAVLCAFLSVSPTLVLSGLSLCLSLFCFFLSFLLSVSTWLFQRLFRHARSNEADMARALNWTDVAWNQWSVTTVSN